MAKKSQSNSMVVEQAAEPEKPRKRAQEPLDPATLKPDAAKHLAKGEDARAKLHVAAEAVELLGLGGTAKQLWEIATKAYRAAEREARRIQKASKKAERKAKMREKKLARIAKLREMLERLEAEDEAKHEA